MIIPKTKNRLTLVGNRTKFRGYEIVTVECSCGTTLQTTAYLYKHRRGSCGCAQRDAVVNHNVTRFREMRKKFDRTKLQTGWFRANRWIWKEAYKAQGGLCYLCKQRESIKCRSLALDHDHETGCFRALLCSKCNVACGSFRDSAKVMRSASMYLSQSTGIQFQDFDAALCRLYIGRQGGVCKICELPETVFNMTSKTIKQLARDHCHRTGFVRGMICNGCNNGLSRADDNPAMLELMAQYVETDWLLVHGESKRVPTSWGNNDDAFRIDAVQPSAISAYAARTHARSRGDLATAGQRRGFTESGIVEREAGRRNVD